MRLFAGRKNTSEISFAGKIRNLCAKSVLYQSLFSFGKSEKSFEDSLFFKSLGIKKASLGIKYFKNSFAKACEDSAICNFVENLCAKLASLSIRSYAVAFFYLGMYSLLVNGVNAALGADIASMLDDIYISLLTVVFSLMLMPFKGTFANLVTKSRILSAVFFKLFFFNEDRFEEKRGYYAHNGILILVGTLLGLSTALIPIGSVLQLCLLFFATLCVFKVPENGLISIILLLPYLSQKHLCLIILTVFLAYLFKLLRAKRVMRFGLFDVIVTLCALVVISGGVMISHGGFSFSSVIPFFVPVLLYFMLVNTSRNDDMTRKFNFAITLSVLMASLALIYDKLYAMGHIEKLQKQISFSFDIAPASMFENSMQIGEFVLLLAPFAISSIVISKAKNKKLIAILSAALCTYLIVLNASLGLILGFAVSVLVFFSVLTRRPVITACIVLSCLIMLIAIPGIFNIDEFLVEPYRLDIYKVNSEIASDYFFTGIGSSDEVYKEVLERYMHNPRVVPSQSFNLYLQLFVRYGLFGFTFLAIFIIYYIRNVMSALCTSSCRISKLCLISALSATLSLLTRGLSDYVFTDYRIYAAFWIVVGLSCAVARYNRNDSATLVCRM